MNWRAWLITATTCLTVTALLVGIKTSQIAQAMAFMESFPPPVETITIAQAQSDSWAPTRLLSGTVRSPEHLVIATEIPGRVVELPFASGDTVPKGAAILVLFNDDLEAQRTALQADLNLVNTQLERNQTLEAEGPHAPECASTTIGTKLIPSLAQSDAVSMNEFLKRS